jgi:hypothetical protein
MELPGVQIRAVAEAAVQEILFLLLAVATAAQVS